MLAVVSEGWYGQYKHCNTQIAWIDTGGAKWCVIWSIKTLLIILCIVELLHSSGEGKCCWNYAKPCTPLPCSIMPCWKEQQLSSWLEWALDWVLGNAVYSSTLCFDWQCHLQHWLPGSSLDSKWCCPWCLMASLCLLFCLSNQVFTHSPRLYYLPHACCRKIGSGVNSVLHFGSLASVIFRKSILPSQHPFLSPKTNLLAMPSPFKSRSCFSPATEPRLICKVYGSD